MRAERRQIISIVSIVAHAPGKLKYVNRSTTPTIKRIRL